MPNQFINYYLVIYILYLKMNIMNLCDYLEDIVIYILFTTIGYH